MSFQYNFADGDDNVFVTHNPAKPTELVGRYAIADSAEIEKIIARANAAQKEWQKTPGMERARRLNAFLDATEAQADHIARAVALEQGKILAEAKAETLKGAAEGRFMAGEAARYGGHSIAAGRENFSNQILRRPRGVIFCVSPWNFPAMTPLRKICPAVAFGNAVVLKPSQFTPAAAFLLANIAGEFFPTHLVQIAMVGGAAAGDIVAKEKIHGVSFTGSVETGRAVYAAAAANLIPAQLELGGKNAAILNDTDNVEAAVRQIAAAAFQTGGQRCTAISRLMVRKELAQEAKKLLAKIANGIVLGDGLNSKTQMGPLCNFSHWQNVCSLVEQAIKEGARALAGGAPPKNAGEKNGYFYRPTILADVRHKSVAGQTEIFGPVLSVLEYETFDEAMTMLNDTEFGLTSSLFSNDNALVQRFINESQNGMMHVNHGTVPDNNMPFGGIKRSGIGAYSVGPTAVNFYTSEHAAYIAF